MRKTTMALVFLAGAIPVAIVKAIIWHNHAALVTFVALGVFWFFAAVLDYRQGHREDPQ
jgi:hypothetical protein